MFVSIMALMRSTHGSAYLTISTSYASASFALDLQSGELTKKGTRFLLPDQPFRLLARLVRSPGVLVTREDLRRELWRQDTFVDFEHGLNAAIKRLRHTLGDSAVSPQFIETLPRRGYRFKAAVEAALWPRRRMLRSTRPTLCLPVTMTSCAVMRPQ